MDAVIVVLGVVAILSIALCFKMYRDSIWARTEAKRILEEKSREDKERSQSRPVRRG